MTSSTQISLSPRFALLDVNVWLALYSDQHIHHESANRWYRSLDPPPQLAFCRQTQLGLFRLLSTETVMKGEVHTQAQCWQILEGWVENGQAEVLDEAPGTARLLKDRTSGQFDGPKGWMDAYLAAFAEAANLTLVTFDRALASSLPGSILLR